MRTVKQSRVLGFRASADMIYAVEQHVARQTIKSGKRHSASDFLREAVAEKLRRERGK